MSSLHQGPADMSPQAMREVLQNLHLHQIELEMQNEELRRVKAEVEVSKARYFSLYDLAPVGYCTVSEGGAIVQANLTLAGLLGVTRDVMLSVPFSGFILPQDQDIYYRLKMQCLAARTVSPDTCELRLVRPGGTSFWAMLQATVDTCHDGAPALRVAVSDVTPHKLLEERMVRREADTKAILDGASDAIFINDRQGRFQYVNQQAEQLLGFSQDELLRMCVTDITPPEDFQLTRHMLAQLMTTGTVRYEPSLLRRDGSTVPVELNATQLADGNGFSACRDISQRKKAEALRLANNKFRDAILDSVPSQIAVLDQTGTILAVNQTWREFALDNRAPPGEPVTDSEIGTNYLDVCNAAQGGDSSDGAAQAHDGILSVIRGTVPVFRMEYPCHSPAGERWFAMVVTPLNAENPGAVVTHTDITEQRKMRDRLLAHAVETEMAASRQQLRELVAFNATTIEAERKHIAREVHDELGQVLTALRMDMSLLRMQFGALAPALPEKVDGMKELVDRAIRGVRNVATSLRPMALDMGLTDALEGLCTEFSARTAIGCVFSAQERVVLDDARAVAVYRIVQESLTNISRHARASQVQVTLGHSANVLGVEVRDNGQGFVAADVQQVKSFGLLGMRERALALGGRLDMVSAPGQGTVIGLTIPIDPHMTEGTP